MVIKQKIENIPSWLIGSMAFCLPFGLPLVNFLGILLGLFGIWNFFKAKLSFTLTSLGWGKSLLIFFFSIHVLSLLWTENYSEGLFRIQQKFLFLLWPWAFALAFEGKTNRSISWTFFLLGLFIAVTSCYIRSYFLHSIPGAWFYTNFSWLMHPSYFSLFVVFGSFLCLLSLLNLWESLPLPKLVWLILYLFFSISLYFIDSKSGQASWATLSGICLFYYIGQRFSLKISFLILGLLFFLSIWKMDQIKNKLGERFQQMLTGIQVGSSHALESTGGRIQSYEAGWISCKENWFLGVGIGDQQATLQKAFHNQNFTYASVHKLNCHNQFLQTWLATGIVGLFTLIFLVLLPSILRPNILSFGFSVLLILNFLVESMLERQIGLFFFTFFYLLLLPAKEKQGQP